MRISTGMESQTNAGLNSNNNNLNTVTHPSLYCHSSREWWGRKRRAKEKREVIPRRRLEPSVGEVEHQPSGRCGRHDVLQ